MLYYDGQLVAWQDKSQEGVAATVRGQIEELRSRFFAKDAPGFAILRYPKGQRKKNVSGYWENKRIYTLDHRSFDGMWVYSKFKKKQKKDGTEDYGDKFTVIRDPHVIQAKDIEFLWYVVYQSSAYKAKRVHIEDLEGEAEVKAKELGSFVDVQYLIYGKTSPIVNDRKLFTEIATVFGVKDVERKGLFQLKNEIYSLVTNGETSGNRFVNVTQFDKLASGSLVRRTSYLIRSAINDGTLKFLTKDYSWWLMAGNTPMESLFGVNLKDMANKEELLMEAVLNDAALKGTIFSALGSDQFESADELRGYDRKNLMSMAKRYNIEFTISDKKEDIVKKLCEYLKLNYEPVKE